MTTRHQSGISAVAIIIIAAGIALIAFVGIYVWRATIDIDTTNAQTVNATSTNSPPAVPDVTTPPDLDTASNFMTSIDIDGGGEASLNQALTF
jgi:hypothetical protein